jgi:lysophospholipase L1-like esterase
MKIKASKIILLLLIITLLASGMLNILCVRRVLDYYQSLQLFRLDPIGASVFAAENEQLQEPEPEKVRVILFGDSRIAYWDPLPSLKNCQLINRGIGGQTTAQTLLRLEGDVLQLKPAIVVLQVGINDLKTIGIFPESKNDIISLCRENINIIVDQIVENDIQAVLLTIFPPGPVDLFRKPIWSDDICHGIEEVNKMIMELEDRGVTVLDCDSILTSGGSIRPEYAKDTLHLTSAGYEALNNSLSPVLNELIRNHLWLEN